MVWLPTCPILSTAKLLTKEEAQQRVSQGLLAATAIVGSLLMAYM